MNFKLKRIILVIIFLLFVFVPQILNAESIHESQAAKLVFNGDKYVFINDIGNINESFDGKSFSDFRYINDVQWTDKKVKDDLDFLSSNSGQYPGLFGICYGKGKFVVVGGQSQAHLFAGAGYIISSEDGVDWNGKYFFSDFSPILNSVIYGTSGFVVVGQKGKILISKDGENWQSIASREQVSLNSVTYEKGKYVIVGESGMILTSVDGKVWTQRASPIKCTFAKVIYVKNKFLALGTDGIISSTDGIKWEQIKSKNVPHLTTCCFGNGIYLAVAEDGVLYCSIDTKNWGKDTVLDGRFSDCVFNGKEFVLSGNNFIIKYKPDIKLFTGRNK